MAYYTFTVEKNTEKNFGFRRTRNDKDYLLYKTSKETLK